MPCYPKNSLIVVIIHTRDRDVHHTERQLLEQLKTDTAIKQRKDIGAEYFECSIQYLMKHYVALIKYIY